MTTATRTRTSTAADAERQREANPPSRQEPRVERVIAAPGTGQRATVALVHAATDAVIRQAYLVARDAATPALTRFAEAYGAELTRLQSQSGGDTEEQEARVLLTWLHESGQLAQMQGPVLRALTTAAHTSLSAILSGQQTAFAAGQAVGTASVEALWKAQNGYLDASGDPMDDSEIPTDELDDMDQEIDTPPIPSSRYGTSGYNGQPISDYTDDNTDDTQQQMATAAAAALLLGQSPDNLLLRLLQFMNSAGGQALLIAESEIQSAFRDALGLVANANQNYVAGWIWQAMADACPFCSDMDQTFHDLDEDMITHPRCRCEQQFIDNNGNLIGGGDAADLGTLAAPGAAAEEEEAVAAEEEAAVQAAGQQVGQQAERETATREGETGAAAAPEVPQRFEEAQSLDELQAWYEDAGGTRDGAYDAIRDQLEQDLATVAPIAGVPDIADALDRIAGERADALADLLDRAEALGPDDRALLDAAGEQGGAEAFQAELERLTGAEFPRADVLTPAETETLLRAAVTSAEQRVATAEQTLVDLEHRFDRAMQTGAARDAILARDYHAAHVGLITARNDLERAQAALRATEEEGFALKEPVTAAATKAAATATGYTAADLSGKTMPELRQIARDAGVQPARSKAETVQRILDKQQMVALAPSDRVAVLRTQLDDRMVQREALYGQQHDLAEEKARLENLQRDPSPLSYAEYHAKIDLYRQTLDQSDPEVKRYLKDAAANKQSRVDSARALNEQRRLEKVMDTLSIQGKGPGSAEWAQARADYEAAGVAQKKAEKAQTKSWNDLWTKSPGVYKPELDSIAGFDMQLRRLGITIRPADIAAHPLVVAAREELATLGTRISDLETQLRALEKPIKDINKQIERQLAELHDLNATLRSGAEALDTLRPFSDVIPLPEGHQPPNALMNKLDYRMHEPRPVTKARIIDDINTRLKDNPAWAEYVTRMPTPDNLGVYHNYVHVTADARDTKSAKLVADLIRKWGVGYRPGTPQWVAMQMATRDEFGLGSAIHAITAAQQRAGEAFYAENGAAYRAFMRAMYDNTQAWFHENGITEIEVYRGFGWRAEDAAVPQGIEWGPMNAKNYGTTEMELNPFQSFSADINISQGTQIAGNPWAGGGFAGGGFGGGRDYNLLIGAKIPVERVLGTAQTGFGAKLESEIVVMGRATDTVAYRAGTTVEAALLRQADEQAVSERELVYRLSDGTTLRVVANLDGTFTLTFLDGPQLAWSPNSPEPMKVGTSKTYKTAAGVNKRLDAFHIANTYVAPAKELAVREGEEGAAAGRAAGEDALSARIDRIPDDVKTVPDIQDWLQAQIPGLNASQMGMPGRVELMTLDPETARLVANATANLIPELPEVANNLWRISAQTTYTDALAMVPRDGLSLIINPEKWLDLADLAERTPGYFAQGWWVAQTPEEILGHEIGHLMQVNYHIANDVWQAALDRVAAAGGNPLVSTYAGDKIEESFAETFALLVYGTPTDAQLPIAREMAALLRDNGLDYNTLRSAVGSPPLDVGS